MGVSSMTAIVLLRSDSVEAGEAVCGGRLLTGVARKGLACCIGVGGSVMDSWSPVPPHGEATAAILGAVRVGKPKSSCRLTSFFCVFPNIQAGAWNLPLSGGGLSWGIPIKIAVVGDLVRPERVGAPGQHIFPEVPHMRTASLPCLNKQGGQGGQSCKRNASR